MATTPELTSTLTITEQQRMLLRAALRYGPLRYGIELENGAMVAPEEAAAMFELLGKLPTALVTVHSVVTQVEVAAAAAPESQAVEVADPRYSDEKVKARWEVDTAENNVEDLVDEIWALMSEADRVEALATTRTNMQEFDAER